MLGVGLIRGINVGGKSRVAKAELTAAFEAAGFGQVVTLLQSGNVVFSSTKAPTAARAREVAVELRARSGVDAGVVLLAEDRFRALAAANPLVSVADDDSKLMLTFLDHDLPDGLTPPADEELAPEVVRFGERIVYQWCPLGVSNSVLPAAFWRRIGAVATGRNQRTVGRILAELDRRA